MPRPPSPSSVGGDAADTPTPQPTASDIVASGWRPWTIRFVVKVDGRRRHFTKFDDIDYCTWRVKIYPDAGWVSVFLQLYRGIDGETAMAEYSFSLLDQDGEPVPSYSRNSSAIHPFASKDSYGYRRFIAGDDLKGYLTDDCFRVRCEIVIHDFCGKRAVAPRPVVVVPPSDLQRQLLALLRSGRGGDVMFEVAGELFSAHRYMLAARSSVFMAELLGPMAEARVRVDDMEPRVFEAMLEFIYTDSYPEAIIDAGEAVEMAQHLLVAADRYNLERLKLICEDMLCDKIDRSTAATTLTLAEQHGCRGLKEACFNFIRWAPGNLEAVMASDGYQHLKASCPSLVKAITDQAAAVSGSHVLKIDGYSGTKGLGNGRCITSIMFVIGGRRWRIQYYPDGHSSEHAGWIAVFIVLDRADTVGTTAKARYEISLLGLDGKPVPSCTKANETPCKFSSRQGQGGALVERKVLDLE